jgi:DNA-binding NtrC family response regulator
MALKKHPFYPILMIDNDPKYRLWEIEKDLISAGYNNIQLCNQMSSISKYLFDNRIKVALIQIHNNANMNLCRRMIIDYPNLSVIAIVDRQDVPRGERCMKHGAFDYVVRPVAQNRIVNVVRHAIETHELKQINMDLQQKLLNLPESRNPAFSKIVTQNHKILAIINYIETLGQSSGSILFAGESGTGKTALAQATHEFSRGQHPICTIDAAQTDGYEFGEIVFGHHCTDNMKPGLLDKAENGSLLIKNVDQLDLVSQQKLLRLLKHNDYIPLGADHKYKSSVRVLATSKTDLTLLEKQGKFRKDLTYFLMQHYIKVPPLRDHIEDISLLVNRFIEMASIQYKKKPPRPPKQLVVLLETYHFPGNVAELQKMIFSAVQNHKSGMLSLQFLKKRIAESMNCNARTIFPNFDEADGLLKFSKKLPTIKQATWLLTAEAMLRARGNQSIASHLLGISQQALSRRLQNMELQYHKYEN